MAQSLHFVNHGGVEEGIACYSRMNAARWVSSHNWYCQWQGFLRLHTAIVKTPEYTVFGEYFLDCTLVICELGAPTSFKHHLRSRCRVG